MIGGRNKQRTCEKFRRNSNRGRRCIVWLIVVSLLVNMPLCTYAFGMNEEEISANEIGGSGISQNCISENEENQDTENQNEENQNGENKKEENRNEVSENRTIEKEMSENEISENRIINPEEKVSGDTIDATVSSGNFYGLTWSIDNEKVLRITGKSTDIPRWSSMVDDNEPKSFFPWLKHDINKVVMENCTIKGVMEAWFYECKMKEFTTQNLNTSEVTNMRMLFKGCYSLRSLDVSEFDTEKVTDMSDMFCNCVDIETIDISSFNTTNVTTMQYMFDNCASMRAVDLDGIKTSKVSDFGSMFANCHELINVDVSGFDTRNAYSLAGMFMGCQKIEELDVQSFDTSNIVKMQFMFSYCSKLKKLDLSSFDMSKARDQETFLHYNFLKENYELEEINTPTNLTCDIALTHTMYDETGQKYTMLPKNQTVSHTLTNYRSHVFGDITALISGNNININADVLANDIVSVNAVLKEQLKNGEIISGSCNMIQTSGHYEANHPLSNDVMLATVTLYAWDKDGDVTESDYAVARAETNNNLIDKEEAKKDARGADKTGYVTVKLDKKSYTYTGSAICPKATVKYTYTAYSDSDKRDGKVKTVKLVQNRDYTITYSENVNAGTGTVMILGMGDYSGLYRKNFTIKPKSFKNVKIEPIHDNIVEEGENCLLIWTTKIKVIDGSFEVNSNDYDVHFFIKGKEVWEPLGTKETQKVVVKINGKGNYKGNAKATQTFSIRTSIEGQKFIYDVIDYEIVQNQKIIFNGKQQKPRIEVTYKDGKKARKSDYVIEYFDNVESGKAIIHLFGRNKLYGYTIIYFTIEKRDMSDVTVKPLSNVFFSDTMGNVRPSVRLGKYNLIEGKDYKVDTKNVRDVSFLGIPMKQVTFTLHAVEDGNFTGSKEVICKVIPRKLNNRLSIKAYCDEMALNPEAKEVCPIPKIYDRGVELKEGRDFKVTEYKNNKKPGKGKVIVEGIGNYTGKRTIKFKIKSN